ncbi:efflux RND transporter periplasmic adaptor subunit [Flavimarina sp. Hel_I_48]|uniref:efflux RND transporter periplasmic adaptor subunit n=1 Tax=Flavimarina sp. Hel_I_48 TaxID=1392488 RepID=UPI0004DFB73C|nr:efflux RND transporter periplasmic adaptor subunit [Flavimarina sp. Hel_I_48]
MEKKKIIIICAAIFAVAALSIYFIFSSEPDAQREGATKKTAMLVEVIPAEKGDFKPAIEATGTVQAVEDIMLSPRVTGQITYRSPSFVPGGFVKKGTVLLKIDPSDYANTVELRKGELMQTQTNLATEMGRQKIAQQDLALIGGDTLSEEDEALVLREPQLKAVKANITSAKAAVSQAQLNLSRTTIRSPFDANIISQMVSTGSQVTPGANLGRLVGADFYWVEVSVPVSKLKWLSFPETEKDTGTVATITNTTGWGANESRQGFVDKQIGALDRQTRLARVLVKVPDPLSKLEENQEKPKLLIGSFVEVSMEATTLENVVKLDRDYVRTNNTVWVMNNGKLEIRDVAVLLTDTENAYINDGLEDKEQVVKTNLSTVAEGIELRQQNSNSTTVKDTSAQRQ